MLRPFCKYIHIHSYIWILLFNIDYVNVLLIWYLSEICILYISKETQSHFILQFLKCNMLGNDHLTWRGGFGFFLKKIFWFPMLLKKIFWFWWRKKKIWFRVFFIKSNVKKWKKINILTLGLTEKKILNETKNHNPPFQVKWSVP